LSQQTTQGRKTKKRLKYQNSKENNCSSKTLLTQQSTLRQKSYQNLNEGIKKLTKKAVPRAGLIVVPIQQKSSKNADLNLSIAVTEKRQSPEPDARSEKQLQN
jgi:hypothetical protein